MWAYKGKAGFFSHQRNAHPVKKHLASTLDPTKTCKDDGESTVLAQHELNTPHKTKFKNQTQAKNVLDTIDTQFSCHTYKELRWLSLTSLQLLIYMPTTMCE